MKTVLQLALVMALGALFGFVLDIFIWREGFNYPILGVLPKILTRGGEGAYDLMSMELVIQCALVFALMWAGVRSFLRRQGRKAHT